MTRSLHEVFPSFFLTAACLSMAARVIFLLVWNSSLFFSDVALVLPFVCVPFLLVIGGQVLRRRLPDRPGPAGALFFLGLSAGGYALAVLLSPLLPRTLGLILLWSNPLLSAWDCLDFLLPDALFNAILYEGWAKVLLVALASLLPPALYLLGICLPCGEIATKNQD